MPPSCPVDHETISCLRSIDAQTLRDASASLDGDGRPLFTDFAPVVDGSYILERPTLALGKRKVNAVRPATSLRGRVDVDNLQDTLMVLTNTNEALIFTPASEVEGSDTVENFIARIFPRLPEAKVKEAEQLYSAPTPAESIHQFAVQIKSECTSYFLVGSL